MLKILVLLFMAVPKKKTSKSKRNLRRYIWKRRMLGTFLIAISFSKSSNLNS